MLDRVFSPRVPISVAISIGVTASILEIIAMAETYYRWETSLIGDILLTDGTIVPLKEFSIAR
jgi:hypothetical protein